MYVMEKLDYEKIIDPLCIPVIKILREDLEVETMFCCQGKSEDDPKDSHHSLTGYIACRKTDRNREILRGILESLGKKINSTHPLGYIETTSRFVILRLRKLQKTKKVWESMEKILLENNIV